MSIHDRAAETDLSDGQEDIWNAAVEVLSELGGDDPDYERIDGAGRKITGAARKCQSAKERIGGDES